MLNKIYSLLLVVSIILMCAVAYLAYSQLQSIGFAPAKIAASFEDYSRAFWGFLAVSSIILLIVGNLILWKFRTSWALWTSLAFFVFFVLLKSFWLGKVLFDYETDNLLSHSSPVISYFLGILLCAAAGAIVFFNHFLVLRMRDKIHGDPAAFNNQSSSAALPEKTEPLPSEETACIAENTSNHQEPN